MDECCILGSLCVRILREVFRKTLINKEHLDALYIHCCFALWPRLKDDFSLMSNCLSSEVYESGTFQYLGRILLSSFLVLVDLDAGGGFLGVPRDQPLSSACPTASGIPLKPPQVMQNKTKHFCFVTSVTSVELQV